MNKQYMQNLVDWARNIYVSAYGTAINSDFANRMKLDKLDAEIFKLYCKYKARPKKIIKLMASACAAMYNNEIIVDKNLWSDIMLLCTIRSEKIYTLNKFRYLIENKRLTFIKSGIRYNRIGYMITTLLGGINVIDS